MIFCYLLMGSCLCFILFTAYCRNPYDTQWYCFDDTRVDPVADTSLVTAAAYILFYQRRGLGTSYSSAASTSSSGSGGLEHWVCRMPAFTRSSKSQEELNHKGLLCEHSCSTQHKIRLPPVHTLFYFRNMVTAC